MKACYLSIFLVLGLLLPAQSFAAEVEGVESFKQDKGAWRRKETEDGRREVTQKMKDMLQGPSLQNIIQAEQAFCYTIEGAAPDFTGYTIDGMEITGFCGILSKPEIDLFVEEFLSKDESVSNVVEKCIIQPRIMLRFMRGVDYSDVLLSSPCHSFTVFYAGRVRSFNASPSSKLVEVVIDAYEKKRTNFVSPALLQQVLPIGVPQTDAQKALVKEKSTQAPVRNWQTETKKAPEPAVPEKKGWNRLNLNKP